jgi:hypothetical protein
MSEKRQELGDPIEIFGDLFAKLYIYMAKEMKKTFGKQGEDAVRRALIDFGHDRGWAIRKKHEEMGLPITVRSLFEYYDLPEDKRFRRNPIKLTENVRYSQTLLCPYQELWREIAPENPEMWSLYCDTVHQAIFEAYLDDIICELPLLLTKGDKCCQFEVYRKGHKNEIRSEDQKEEAKKV